MRTSQVFVFVGLCALSACERADDRSDPHAAVAPASVATPTPTPTPTPPAPVSPRLAPPRIAPPSIAPSRMVPPRITPPKPAAAQLPDPRVRSLPANREATPTSRTVAATAATGALPEPPSVVPEEYKLWLGQLARADQQRIASFCAQHRTDFQVTCGGIGPLHIPYPPYPRAHMPGPNDLHSLFASGEEWHDSLSPRQLRYLDRVCIGGEDSPSSDLCGDNTPLVVAFDNQPITFARGGTFAFQPGVPEATDWPTASTPWIALDRDGDGTIASGAELFGSDTQLAGGGTAVNGFAALAELDANHDGRIDASDPAFGKLVLWADRDGDQHSDAGELTALSTAIVSISLAHRIELRCDARDNCEGERAAFTWRDAAGGLHDGTVVDVYLPRR